MELLVVILKKEEYLKKIVSLLVELDVQAATILDSEDIRHFLAYEMPLFADLKDSVAEKKISNKTIIALIEDKKFFLVRLKKMFSEENIDFKQSDIGFIITLPVNDWLVPKHEKL